VKGKRRKAVNAIPPTGGPGQPCDKDIEGAVIVAGNRGREPGMCAACAGYRSGGLKGRPAHAGGRVYRMTP
jgi:hypothetical protein